VKVPFIDLKAQHESIGAEIREAVERVINSQQFILGEEVERLEEEMRVFLGVRHCIGVASGTDALWLSLWALGVGKGDLVITTPFTFVATAEVISILGASPLFVDIEPRTFTLSTHEVRRCLDSLSPASKRRVKGIVAVHIFGNCCDMEGLLDVAAELNVWVVEDAAQAMGAFCEGRGQGLRAAGTWGETGCLSFYPTKNLGAMGDGGMVVTQRNSLTERIRQLRNHGSPERYIHLETGTNSRLDAIQAAVLRVKLKHLRKWNEMRVERAKIYDHLLRSSGLTKRGLVIPSLIHEPEADGHHSAVFHQYVIRVPKHRDALRDFLREGGIGVDVYYPLPLHLQPCYRGLGHKRGDFPEAERASLEVLSLPMYPELPNSHQQYVVEKMEEFFKKRV
jgi:dTDP-4-amino-4,6-dideoxygalactose transaminase